MSNAVKWALLGVGAVVLIGMVLALPISNINIEALTSGIVDIVEVISPYTNFARGLINNFLTPAGVNILNGVLIWMFAKFAILIPIKIVVWAYHFIFRG